MIGIRNVTRVHWRVTTRHAWTEAVMARNLRAWIDRDFRRQTFQRTWRAIIWSGMCALTFFAWASGHRNSKCLKRKFSETIEHAAEQGLIWRRFYSITGQWITRLPQILSEILIFLCCNLEHVRAFHASMITMKIGKWLWLMFEAEDPPSLWLVRSKQLNTRH